MSRIVRAGLIQATLCEPSTSSTEKIRNAMIDKHVDLIAQAAIIGVGTRWSMDDLLGRLAESGSFEVVRLPAIAEDNDKLGRKPGEALWPERYPAEALANLPGTSCFLPGGLLQNDLTRLFIENCKLSTGTFNSIW